MTSHLSLLIYFMVYLPFSLYATTSYDLFAVEPPEPGTVLTHGRQGAVTTEMWTGAHVYSAPVAECQELFRVPSRHNAVHSRLSSRPNPPPPVSCLSLTEGFSDRPFPGLHYAGPLQIGSTQGPSQGIWK